MFETENIFKVAQFHRISTAKNIVPKIIFIYLESHCIFKDVLHDVWADSSRISLCIQSADNGLIPP